jgi:hypothetical protein
MNFQQDYREITIGLIQRLARQGGVELDYTQAFDVCNDLVIGHVLVWERDNYQLANATMASFARKNGFLESGIARVKSELLQQIAV